MNKVLLFLLLPWLSLSFCASAAAIDDKAELERVVIGYEKLAAKAKACPSSGNISSESCKSLIKSFNSGEVNKLLNTFTSNVSNYFAIDQNLAMRGVTAIITIADALRFIWEEHNK
ncbi:hypothetical protein [Alteromonas lipotrueiana]|uniref:hypothetical protein n=1 Tax=Alteromonas lipotrueiana TaxID=2803815 RepID=UPI001C485E33|nr:hypothetical protein [Alteromonas lipotrueiana]